MVYNIISTLTPLETTLMTMIFPTIKGFIISLSSYIIYRKIFLLYTGRSMISYYIQIIDTTLYFQYRVYY